MSVLACDLDLRPMTSCTPPSRGHVAVIDRGRVAIIYLLTTDPKVAEFFFQKTAVNGRRKRLSVYSVNSASLTVT